MNRKYKDMKPKELQYRQEREEMSEQIEVYIELVLGLDVDYLTIFYGNFKDIIDYELSGTDLLELCQDINIDLYRVFNGDYYIELHSNRTLWKIESNITNDEYNMLVGVKIHEFEEITGVEVYTLGRSGRHICIDLSAENILRYDELKDIALELEQELIREINNNKDNYERA